MQPCEKFESIPEKLEDVDIKILFQVIEASRLSHFSNLCHKVAKVAHARGL